jgi:hypothetical protein
MKIQRLDGLGPLLQPDKKTPVTITLLGSDSAEYQAVARAQVSKRVSRGREQGAPEDMIAEAEADAIALLVAATTGWDGMATANGDPVPFTPANATMLYNQFPAVRDQAEAFVRDRGNFTSSSPTGLKSSPAGSSDKAKS